MKQRRCSYSLANSRRVELYDLALPSRVVLLALVYELLDDYRGPLRVKITINKDTTIMKNSSCSLSYLGDGCSVSEVINMDGHDLSEPLECVIHEVLLNVRIPIEGDDGFHLPLLGSLHHGISCLKHRVLTLPTVNGVGLEFEESSRLSIGRVGGPFEKEDLLLWEELLDIHLSPVSVDLDGLLFSFT